MMMGWAALMLGACDFSSSMPKPHYPDEQSQAFSVYARNCSECHAPPLPTAHPANEWPGVIERMQLHLVERSMAPIKDEDKLVLRNYLVSHSVGG